MKVSTILRQAIHNEFNVVVAGLAVLKKCFLTGQR